MGDILHRCLWHVQPLVQEVGVSLFIPSTFLVSIALAASLVLPGYGRTPDVYGDVDGGTDGSDSDADCDLDTE